MKQKIPIKD